MSKSYKKAVTIGVAAFSAVALLTTGAAAFVLTNEATNTTNGNVTVGAVVDNGISLSMGSQQAAIVLDADTDDKTGRVQFTSNKDGTTLNTNISISGKLIPTGTGVSTSEIVAKYDLSFTFAVSSDNLSVGDSSEAGSTFFPKYVTTKSKKASVSEYLTLTYTDTKGSNSKSLLDVDTATAITVAADGTFDLDIDFNWGSFFGWTNPSIFYDTVSSLTSGDSSVSGGATTNLEAVKSALDTLYDMNGLKFTVTLKAALKTGTGA